MIIKIFEQGDKSLKKESVSFIIHKKTSLHILVFQNILIFQKNTPLLFRAQ